MKLAIAVLLLHYIVNAAPGKWVAVRRNRFAAESTTPRAGHTFAAEDLKELSGYSVLNYEFCRKQDLKGKKLSYPLPWWYSYCQNLNHYATNKLVEKDPEVAMNYHPYYSNMLQKFIQMKKSGALNKFRRKY